MGGGNSGDESDAIRAEPVIRYLANADLADPLWQDPRVEPSIFAGPYRIVFEAMVLAYQRGLPRTSAIIARCAQEQGIAILESTVEDLIRGAEYVDTRGVRAQLELLIQERDRKAALSGLSTAVKTLAQPGVDPAPVLAGIFGIVNTPEAATPRSRIEVVRNLDEQYAQNEPGSLLGLSSGVRALDRITNGFPRQFLTVIAARVAVGKSAFAMQLARLWVAMQLRVMYFSLELTATQFLGRWIAQQANINFTNWQMNQLEAADRQRCNEALAAYEAQDEYLSLFASGELREPTRDTIAQLVMRQPPDQRPRAIIVDLMTNLRPVASERITQDWQRLDRDSDMLRNLAIATDSTVFAVCQLNRDMTKRKDKRPQLSDIRASGAIEQNADQVILLDNPEIVGQQERGVSMAEEQKMYLHVNKNRNGKAGCAEALWVAGPMLVRDATFTRMDWGQQPAPRIGSNADLFGDL